MIPKNPFVASIYFSPSICFFAFLKAHLNLGIYPDGIFEQDSGRLLTLFRFVGYRDKDYTIIREASKTGFVFSRMFVTDFSYESN